MQRRSAILAASFLASLAAAAPVRAASDAELRRRIDELERQLEEQRKTFSDQIEQLKQQIGQEEEPAKEAPRVEEVERKQGILTEELRKIREALVLPETKELKSTYGYGPAASKVYGIQHGLSIGGYGELNFDNEVSDKTGADTFDLVRFVLYFGYKFNDWIVLNSEVEVEHASTESSASAGDGEVEAEFATLDFLFHPMVNARAGLVLVPVGFLNETHEPPFYHGNVRPPVETQILPSTWRANGFGLFGELLPGLQYRTYGITGLNAAGFGRDGIREGRQNGNRERANDWAWVARLDYAPVPELLVGGSVFLGDSGQNQRFGDPNDPTSFRKPDVFTQIYELHAQARTHGLELRALGAYIDVANTSVLSIDPDVDGPVANVMLGAYGEIAYDVMPVLWPATTQYLAPWFRYSWLDTQNSVPSGFHRDPQQRQRFYEMGLSYKPITQVVFKLDYRIQDRNQGSLPDEVRVGAGYVF